MVEANQTGRAKLQLGWGEDNPEEYRRWRRQIKAYAISKKITGRRDASVQEWDRFKSHAMNDENGLPASGRALLQLPRGDKEGDRAKDRFHYLLLDALKKDRETLTREGLQAGQRKRRRAANDVPEELAADPAEPPMPPPSDVVRVVIVEPDVPGDVVNAGNHIYKWANANRSQLVKLEKHTLQEIYKTIADRIPNDKYIRAIFGACDKPPANGNPPIDIERMCTDDDLANFIQLMRDTYKPITFQVVLVREGGPDDQTPHPDDRDYFPHDRFEVEEEPHDPVTSDSDNELYLMQFGRKKPRGWPRSDHGFEHEAAKTRKRIRRLKKHLSTLLEKHRKFLGRRRREMINYNDEMLSQWITILNPQNGKDHVTAREAARAAKDARQAVLDQPPVDGETEEELDERANEAGLAAATEIFGPPQVGDFNGW